MLMKLNELKFSLESALTCSINKINCQFQCRLRKILFQICTEIRLLNICHQFRIRQGRIVLATYRPAIRVF